MRKCVVRSVGVLMALVLFGTSMNVVPPVNAEAATLYITAEKFAEALVKEIDIKPGSQDVFNGYYSVLIASGIMNEGDCSSPEAYVTRGTAMILLNRADEYLYGNTLEEEVVQMVIDKRISDIKTVEEGKRVDVAKAFLKGYMKGYSNGTYSTNRRMNLTSKMTKSGALSCIKLLKNQKSRAKISPDGQLIRTTKLPLSAKKFPYILASYPNSYYDWKLIYECGNGCYESEGKKYPNVNLVQYAAPVDIDKIKGVDDFDAGFGEIRKKYLISWVDKVQSYLEHVFSVNYKTIDEEWMDEVAETDYSYGERIEKGYRADLEEYVTAMKENKTIVEYSKIRVDGSSLYYFNGSFYLRAYVQYRIVSSKIKYGVDADTLIMEEPYNDILWSRATTVDFTGFTLGKWRECGYDICLDTYTSKTNIGVTVAYLNEYYCKQYPVTK
jgi:hypothetical protein